jgi:hypothetical protein
MCQKHKRIPLARRVRLRRKESLQELRGIGDEVFKFTIDGVYCEDGVFADIRVTVFEAGAADWDERFEEFGVFGYFLEEAEGCAADIFVWMLLGML